jgi:hypothetical protein
MAITLFFAHNRSTLTYNGEPLILNEIDSGAFVSNYPYYAEIEENGTLQLVSGDTSFSIYDNDNQKNEQEIIEGTTTTIDVSNYPNGVYFYTPYLNPAPPLEIHTFIFQITGIQNAITDLTNMKLTFLDVLNLENGIWQINFKSNNQNFTSFTVENSTPAPVETGYLTFSSEEPFSLTVDKGTMYEGSLEYSTDASVWTPVVKGTAIPSVNNKVYLRGSDNTMVYSEEVLFNDCGTIQLTGYKIKCEGNIGTLLDYQTVLNGQHPSMSDKCFSGMFGHCTNLITAPVLPATTLANGCYSAMFYGCTSLITAPVLPATTLADRCYESMFSGCTSLAQAPALPATTLVDYCYMNMFSGCTSLTQAPALPATTLANGCYAYMFSDCISLTQAPELPVTTLTKMCYYSMFSGCTSLTQAPELPATTLTNNCYTTMFRKCTSLTQAPALPATTLANDCYGEMFGDCTSLTQAPALPATTLANGCYGGMFWGCTSLTQAPALPATTLADYCYDSMFQDCTSIKLSTAQTEEYVNEYRIPYGTEIGTTANNALNGMFTETGGTFTGTPEINKTYYTSNEIVGAPVETYNITIVNNAINDSPWGGTGANITIDEPIPTTIRTDETVIITYNNDNIASPFEVIVSGAEYIDEYIPNPDGLSGINHYRLVLSNPTEDVTITFESFDPGM